MGFLTDRELGEVAGQFAQRQSAIFKARASRRRVLSGAAILAAGGIVAACSSGSKPTGSNTTSTNSTGAAAVATSNGKAASGLSAQIPAALRAFPYVDKYNWRRLKWGGKPYLGGTLQVAGFPPGNYDLMTTETLTQFPAYMNGLYYSAIHTGLNLDTPAIEADLAQTTEHTPDYTSWTFTLPKNAYFHDLPPVNGAQMTSADVQFSFQRYIDTSLWNVPLSEVDHITAPDPYTITFALKRPVLDFPNILALPYYMVFNPKHYADHQRFAAQVIGTGAYVLTSSKPAQTSTADRNPKYWGTSTWLPGYTKQQLPFADHLNQTYFADTASLDAGLRGQSVDAADLEGALPSRIDDLLKGNPKLQVATDAEWALTPKRIFLSWNNPLFKDVRIRRALSMALDRQNIVKVAFGGAAIAQSSPVPYDQMGLQGPPSLDQMGPYFKYDPSGAKKLLAAAGHPNGFKFTAFMGETTASSWILLVQKYWKAIGVEVQLQAKQPLEESTIILKKNFDAIMSEAEGSILGYDIDRVLRPMFYPGSPQNYANVNDPELTQVMDKIHSSTSPSEVTSLAKQAFDIFNRNVDVIYVAGYHTWYVTQPWIHTIANTYYTTIGNYASESWRNVWIDSTAPSGRGGKPA